MTKKKTPDKPLPDEPVAAAEEHVPAQPVEIGVSQLANGTTITKTEHDNEADWHVDRRTSGGASDASVLLGCAHFKKATLLNMYMSKMGLLPPWEPTEYMVWGHRMEPVIVAVYGEEAGFEITDPGPYTIYRNSSTPWLHATPDFFANDPERGLGTVQVKNVGTHQEDHWRNGIPMDIRVQMQQEMWCTGCCWSACAWLIGGQKFLHVETPYHQGIVDALIEEGRLFMENIQSESPVEPDAEAEDIGMLLDVYPEHQKDLEIIIEADDPIWTHVNGYLQADKEEKLIVGGKNYHKARLIQRMGHAVRMTLPDTSGFSLKSSVVAESIRKSYIRRPLLIARKKAKKS